MEIHIRHLKSNKPGGKRIEVFSFTGHNCCPVKALKNLKTVRLSKNEGLLVFAFTETSFLSRLHFNTTIKNLLKKHLPEANVQGHSVRAGIQSVLSSIPELASTEEIQAWG
jgi:hypothetical protein